MTFSVTLTNIPTAELAEKVRERCLTEARHIDVLLSRLTARIDCEASRRAVVSESAPSANLGRQPKGAK